MAPPRGMAKRIIQGRTARAAAARPNSGQHVLPNQPQQQEQQQQALSPFGSISPKVENAIGSQQNGFASNSSTGIASNQQSNTFTPPGGVGLFGGQTMAPSAFNFSINGTSSGSSQFNPFASASLNTEASSAPSNDALRDGFQGSLFNIPKQQFQKEGSAKKANRGILKGDYYQTDRTDEQLWAASAPFLEKKSDTPAIDTFTGTTAQSSGQFGQPINQSQQFSSNSGQSANQSQQSPSPFSQSTNQSQQSYGLFGQFMNQSPSPFGQSKDQSQQSPGLFGQFTNQSHQSPGLFNQPLSQSQQPQSVFSQAHNQSFQTQPNTMIFGAGQNQRQEQATESNVFGYTQTNSNPPWPPQINPSLLTQSHSLPPLTQPTSNPFGLSGNQSQQQISGVSVFGQQTDQSQEQPTLNAFGQQPIQGQQQKSESNVFGQPISHNQQQSDINIFGQPPDQSQRQKSVKTGAFSEAMTQFTRNTQSHSSSNPFTQSQQPSFTPNQPQQQSSPSHPFHASSQPLADEMMISPPKKRSHSQFHEDQSTFTERTLQAPEIDIDVNLQVGPSSDFSPPSSQDVNLSNTDSELASGRAFQYYQYSAFYPQFEDYSENVRDDEEMEDAVDSEVVHPGDLPWGESLPFQQTLYKPSSPQPHQFLSQLAPELASALAQGSSIYYHQDSPMPTEQQDHDMELGSSENLGAEEEEESTFERMHSLPPTAVAITYSKSPMSTGLEQLVLTITKGDGSTNLVVPPGLTEAQREQYITAYRLRSLDIGLRNHIRNTNSFSADSVVMRFHKAKRREILAEARKKRRSTNDGRNNATNDQSNRITTNGSLINGEARARQVPSPSSSGKRRKVDENGLKDRSIGGAKSSEKARGKNISYPALPSSAQASQTANLFANIARSTNNSKRNTSDSVSANKNECRRQSSSSIATNPSIPTGDLAKTATAALSSATFKFGASEPLETTNTFSRMSSSGGIERAVPNPTIPSSFNVPKFSAPSGTDFMAQFGQSAQKDAEKFAKEEKAKRKAEEFDSEDDDEAEWERRYEEKQRAKKAKITEVSKTEGFRFVLGKSDSVSHKSQDARKEEGTKPVTSLTQNDDSKPSAGGILSKTPFSTLSGASIFANVKPADSQLQSGNLFGYLSNPGSDIEGSKTGDADNEESDDSGDDDGQGTPAAGSETSNRSIFDRIEHNEDGTPKRDSTPPVASKPENPPNHSFSFATSGSNLFGQNKFLPSPAGSDDNSFAKLTSAGASSSPTSAQDLSSHSPVGDRTWKVDSPIKFGRSSNAPSVSITAASPIKPTIAGQTSGPFTGLFGPASNSTTSFVSEKPTRLLSAPSATTNSGHVGFGFGGPPKPSSFSFGAPSGIESNATSRATSPGLTTGGESANESADESQNDAQINLASARAGEENEDAILEMRAKAREFGLNKGSTKEWIVRGVGSLRILKHRGTGKVRVQLRADPSGKVVLNAALISTVTYKQSSERAVTFSAATGSGQLVPWTIAVGSKEAATNLAMLLQENKGN